jgi:hypothetical protein
VGALLAATDLHNLCPCGLHRAQPQLKVNGAQLSVGPILKMTRLLLKFCRTVKYFDKFKVTLLNMSGSVVVYGRRGSRPANSAVDSAYFAG